MAKMNSYGGKSRRVQADLLILGKVPSRQGGSYPGRRWLAAALALVTSAFACGGRVGGEEVDGTGGSSSSDGDSNSNHSTGGASKPSSPFDSTALGPCHLGFDPDGEPARRCAWLAKGLCYETKLAACACICPRNRQDSVCASGFDDELTEKKLVSCY